MEVLYSFVKVLRNVCSFRYLFCDTEGLSTVHVYGSEIWTLRQKDKKTIHITRNGIFWKNSGIHTFWLQEKLRNLGRVESRTSLLGTKKIHIKLATTCSNKNEQQQDANSNADL